MQHSQPKPAPPPASVPAGQANDESGIAGDPRPSERHPSGPRRRAACRNQIPAAPARLAANGPPSPSAATSPHATRSIPRSRSDATAEPLPSALPKDQSPCAAAPRPRGRWCGQTLRRQCPETTASAPNGPRGSPHPAPKSRWGADPRHAAPASVWPDCRPDHRAHGAAQARARRPKGRQSTAPVPTAAARAARRAEVQGRGGRPIR